MLSQADNDYLCRVGPGTPMGNLLRRFWLPAMLPSELPEVDCAPARLRLLGEDLVAFRDSSGQLGLVADNCPHRGASMFFGRNEENGLRCVYHGWKFDSSGACVDMPNEPPESSFKQKVRIQAYRLAEWGGLLWAYLGPPELQPELPEHEWALVPPSHRYLAKWTYPANWVQGFEGEIDTSHISFLHTFNKTEFAPANLQLVHDLWQKDKAPRLTFKETEYGFTYGSRRDAGDGSYYWRVTQFCLPSYSLIPAPIFPRGGRVYIPVDDENTWVFSYTYHPERPLTDHELALQSSGAGGTPRIVPGSFKTVVSRENDFLIDREDQRTRTYTGIFGVNEQDLAIVQSMGNIIDRTKERLGTSDLAVIGARRILIRLAKQLEQGIEPYAASHGAVYRVRALDAIEPEAEFGRLIERHQEDVRVS